MASDAHLKNEDDYSEVCKLHAVLVVLSVHTHVTTGNLRVRGPGQLPQILFFFAVAVLCWGQGGTCPQILPRPPKYLISSIVILLSRCCLPKDEGPGPQIFFLEPPLVLCPPKMPPQNCVWLRDRAAKVQFLILSCLVYRGTYFS